MTQLSLASLLVQESKAKLYSAGLSIATAIGLPVSSWQPGDPTRSQFHLQSEVLATLETIVVQYVQSGFLDYCTYPWLKILAYQVYQVTVPEATAATTDVVLTNAGGGLYEIEPGDLTFKNTTTGKTYRNTTGGVLASGPGTTLIVTVVADEAGSDSSAGAGQIDEMVTSLLGVTCTNPLAAVGIDEQDEETTRVQCRAKLGMLSPNGPKEAYTFVALSPDLTGTNAVTRARAYADSDYGDVLVYLAGPSGAVSGPDRTLVEAAILSKATPLCITPTVQSVTVTTVAVTYQLWLYKSANKSAAEAAADVETALEQMFADRPIGGDIIPPSSTGALYRSLIESTIRSVFPQAFRVLVTSPASDATIANGSVAALGTVTSTVTIVVDP